MTEGKDKENELKNAIEYYERLINSGLKMLEDEEVDLLLSERDAIHDLISLMAIDQTRYYGDRIRLLDRNLLSQLESIDLTRFSHPEYPLKLWWWHLDRLDELTEADRSTL